MEKRRAGFIEQSQYKKIFHRYSDAARFAKALAPLSNQCVVVQRCADVWIAHTQVLTIEVKYSSDRLAERILAEKTDDDEKVADYDCDDEPEEEYREYWVGEEEDYPDYNDHEMELEMLREEIFDDQECWARSEEQGWYYGE